MSDKKLLFSVTAKDFELQTFTVSGHGGGGKDTSNNGVRLVHRPSGAVGEGRSHRDLTHNRRDALHHLAASKKFKIWHKLETGKKLGKKSVEQLVEESMHLNNIKVEVRDDSGKWTDVK